MNWRALKPGTLVTIQDLIDGGRAMLTGVNTKVMPTEWMDATRGDETPEVISFCIDGVWISACQNPQDGYRSSMEGLMVVGAMQMAGTSTELTAINVYFTRDRSSEYRADILEMHDGENGEVILRVGTANKDDYYPYWVAGWYPENLEENQLKTRQENRKRGREERKAEFERKKAEGIAADIALTAKRNEIGWATW